MRSPQLHVARARSRADDLTQALADSLGRAKDLDYGPANVLDLDRFLDRASALALDINSGDNLTRARSRADDLNSIIDDAVARSRALGATIDHARALTRDLGHISTFYGDRDRASALARHWMVGRAFIRDLNRVKDLNRALTRDLNRAATGRRGGAEQVVPVAGRLLAAAALLLPARERARYAEEFESELREIAHADGRRRAQLAYGARQVMSAWRLRAELKGLRRRGAAP
jgi:hypothetical protein